MWWHEHGAVVLGHGVLGDQRRDERRGDPGVLAVRLDRLVGEQVGLHDQLQVVVERLDLVADRGDRALGERHQPLGAHPHPAAGRRLPHGVAAQRAGAEVEHPVVLDGAAVAHVERLVLDQQPDDLAVGDVDDRLAVLRVAVAGLGVGQRVLLVEAVEVRAGQAARLALLEGAAHADVAVGQREDRLGALERVEVEGVPAQLPRGDLEAVAHDSPSSSSARSSTTTSAPWAAQRLGLARPRSTPTTYPKPPVLAGLHAGRARPRRRPRCSGVDAERLGAGEERVGRGFAAQARARRSRRRRRGPRRSRSGRRPRARASPLADEVTTAIRQAGLARGLEVAHRAGVGVDAPLVDDLLDAVVLPVADPVHRVRVGRVVGRALGQRRCLARRRGTRAPRRTAGRPST